MKIRLALADDHPALLAGIKHELDRFPTLDVIGTARNSSEIIELLSRGTCDVLVTDYAMPGGDYGDGMALLAFLRRRYPDLKIIVFTTIDNPAMSLQISKLGIQSVLNKVDEVGDLITAIHAAYAGATYIPSRVRAQTPVSAGGPSGELTSREAEVVRLYVSGMSINAIATQLHRSKQTISTQKVNAMRKLGIERDAELFRYAFESGLVVGGVSTPTET
ncbi:two component transcriptional regulator, LuxR family [Burkholderia sp. GAS332]|nr:two component transcriptional regulator, LuxR family [Burkholderia sp. GAS332]